MTFDMWSSKVHPLTHPDRNHANTFSFAAKRRDFKTVPVSASTVADLFCCENSGKKKKKNQTFCLLEGEWIVLVHKTETVFLALLEHTGHSFTAFIAAHYGKIINCVALTQSTDKRTLSVHPADILQYKSLLQGPHPLS